MKHSVGDQIMYEGETYTVEKIYQKHQCYLYVIGNADRVIIGVSDNEL